MPEPSIKATAFQSVADDFQRLLEEKRLSREELELRLEPRDLRYLDEKLMATSWVPIDSYARLVELLAEREAPGNREGYLVERGRRAAARLAGLGIYSQLEATTEHLGIKVGRMIVTLSQAIYNFTEWHFEPNEEERGFQVRVRQARALPEASRLTTQGFIEAVATRAGGYPVRVVSNRPDPDTVDFLARRAVGA